MAAPIYYPEDYGAVGDNATQDHVAINNAISAAAAASPRGGIVPLRRAYLIGAPIVMKNAVCLLGPGVPYYTDEAGPAVSDPYSANHVGQIRCVGGMGDHCIVSSHAADWSIIGIRILNDQSDGDRSAIRCNDTWRTRIDYCMIRSGGAKSAANRKEIFFGNSASGNEQIRITNTRIEGGGFYGEWTNAIHIDTCEFSGGAYGVYVSNSSLVDVVSTHLYEHSINEIYMEYSHGIGVFGGELEQAHQHTMVLRGCQDATVHTEFKQNYINKDTPNTYDFLNLDTTSTTNDMARTTVVGCVFHDTTAADNPPNPTQIRYNVNVNDTGSGGTTHDIAVTGCTFGPSGTAGSQGGGVNFGGGVSTPWKLSGCPGVADAKLGS